MERRLFSLIFAFSFLLFSGSVFADEIGQHFVHGLASYSQEITLEFASPEEAAAAELTKLEMPIGKKLAVSSRWDDSSREHLLMSRTLAENGWKGTFFLNKCDENYAKDIVSQLVKDGHSIGVHTTRHPHLEQVEPNRMFEEILGNRVMLESVNDLCASTFTFPFGLGRDTEDSLTAAHEQGIALVRAGLLGGPESINMAERLGLKPEQFVSPYRFVANDSDPQLETFEKGWKTGENLIAEGKSTIGPYIALGTHSWQRRVHQDGFERLGNILATKSNLSEIWYCDSNEYTAYRLNFLFAEIKKKSVNGNRAVFVISRIEPQETAAVVDLGVKVSPLPQKALFSHGKILSVNDSGEFMIPNEASQTLPVHIDRIDNPENGPADAETLISTEFPGLKIGSQIDLEKNVLNIVITNETGKTITKVKGHIRLPLKWKGETPLWFVEKIENKSTLKMNVSLGEIESSNRFRKGELFIDNQCDFLVDGEVGRIHSTVTIRETAEN